METTLRPLKKSFWALLAMLFLVEAWTWDTLGPVFGRIAAWLPVERTKRAIRSLVSWLPPWATLPVFLLPGLALMPFKIGGMWLIANGHPFLGTATFLLAKSVGVGLAAFFFEVCKPNLMRMAWFAALHDRVVALRAWAHRQADPYLKGIREALASARASMTAMLPRGRAGRRIRSIRFRSRRALRGA